MCLKAIDTTLHTEVYASDANKKHNYKCRDCHEELILKQGLIREHHFAHKTNTQCLFSGTGESATHDKMKHAIKEIIEKQLHPTISEIEYSIGPYYADYYFEEHEKISRKVAVECVWKHTQFDDYLEKQEYYLREGICCIWLFNKEILYTSDDELKNELRFSEIHNHVLKSTEFFHNKNSILLVDTSSLIEPPQLVRLNVFRKKGCKSTYKYTVTELPVFTTQYYNYHSVELVEKEQLVSRYDRENVLACAGYLSELLTDYFREQFSEEITISSKTELVSSNLKQVLFHVDYDSSTCFNPLERIRQSLCDELKVGFNPHICGDNLDICLTYGNENPYYLQGLYEIGIHWKQLRNRKRFQYKSLQSHCKRMLQRLFNEYPLPVNKYEFTIENLGNKLITVIGDYQWLEDNNYITINNNRIALTKRAMKVLKMNLKKINYELLNDAPQEYSIFLVTTNKEENKSEKYNNTYALHAYAGTFFGEISKGYNGNTKYYYEFQDKNGNLGRISKEMFKYLDSELEEGEDYHLQMNDTSMEIYHVLEGKYVQIQGTATTKNDEVPKPETKTERPHSSVQQKNNSSQDLAVDERVINTNNELYEEMIKPISKVLYVSDYRAFFTEYELKQLGEIKGQLTQLQNRSQSDFAGQP